LVAARAGAGAVVFDDPALAERTNPEIADAIERETGQFEARRSNDLLRAGILGQRIEQSKRQIDAFERQLLGMRQQQSLLREELSVVVEMYKKGYERKPRMLALQRAEADSVAREGALMANIAQAEAAIAEVQLEIANLKAERMEELDATLAEVVTKRRQAEELIRKSADQVQRSAVRAPVSGIVFNSHFKTPGGVIRPGEPILEIVPLDEELIVDARLSTRDIDEVHKGQPAHIIFPTFPQRHIQRIRATVTSISADAFMDDQARETFYTVKVKIDRDHLHAAAPNAVLEPGMPAEVFIATGDRTVLDYLVQPLKLAIERSMKEH
jgi:HlyD family type I secretion membrane fusion protein